MKAKNRTGSTPLHSAAEKGHLEICKLLIGHNEVENDSENNRRSTPLHIAAYHGHSKVCKILLENKVDINSRTDVGKSNF